MATDGNRERETATDKLLRVQQGLSLLADYDSNLLTVPDGMDSVLYQIDDWAQLGEIWDSLSEIERSRMAANSVFLTLLRVVRRELTRIADSLENRLQAIIDKAGDKDLIERLTQLAAKEKDAQKRKQLRDEIEVRKATGACLMEKARVRMLGRVDQIRRAVDEKIDSFTMAALYAIAQGGGYPDYLLARICITAIDAQNNPKNLNTLRIAELRGDLLWVVADLNYSVVMAMRHFADKGMKGEAGHARRSLDGGKEQATPTATEAEWKRLAVECRIANPEWNNKPPDMS